MRSSNRRATIPAMLAVAAILLAVGLLAPDRAAARSPLTTTTSDVAYAYDASTTARIHVHMIGGAEAGPARLSDVRDESARPSVDGRGTSTTPLARNNATKSVPFGEIGPAGNPGSLRTVIGKVDDLQAPGAIGSGERTLLDRLPNQGSPRANWAQNDGVLRQEMGRGMPIRDASIDPATGELVSNTGFLRAERNLLESRGWTYDPKTTMWYPPG